MADFYLGNIFRILSFLTHLDLDFFFLNHLLKMSKSVEYCILEKEINQMSSFV